MTISWRNSCWRRTSGTRTCSFTWPAAPAAAPTSSSFPAPPPLRKVSRYGTVLDRVQGQGESWALAVEAERDEAPDLFVELMSRPAERWAEILRAEPRFQSWGLFELLIERSRETVTRDACFAEDLARLALGLSERLERLPLRSGADRGSACPRLGLRGQRPPVPLGPARRRGGLHGSLRLPGEGYGRLPRTRDPLRLPRLVPAGSAEVRGSPGVPAARRCRSSSGPATGTGPAAPW